MKITTERDRILEVSARWDAQYPPNNCSEDKRKIGDALRKIDLSTATGDDIEKIIGNRSWTAIAVCDECGAENIPTVQLGEEPDYESNTAWICESCLKKALALLNQERKI